MTLYDFTDKIRIFSMAEQILRDLIRNGNTQYLPNRLDRRISVLVPLESVPRGVATDTSNHEHGLTND